MDPNIKWEETEAGQRRPRLRVRQPAAHRRHRLVRQADRRPALHRAGRGVQQPVELRHHQHRQHAEPGSSSASVPGSWMDGREGLNWQADFTAAQQQQRASRASPRSAGRPRRSSRARSSGGVGTRIQVLTPGQPVNSFYVYEHIRENGQPIYRDVNGDRVDGTRTTHQRAGPVRGPERRTASSTRTISGRSTTRRRSGSWATRPTSTCGQVRLRASRCGRTSGNYVYNNVASNHGQLPRAHAAARPTTCTPPCSRPGSQTPAVPVRLLRARTRRSCGWTT